MSIKSFYDGLTILAKYYDFEEEHIESGHDVVYGPSVEIDYDKDEDEPTDPKMPEADAKLLEKLGWHVDADSSCWAY